MSGSPPIASWVGCDSAHVELSLLRAVSEERRARWRSAGLTCELVKGRPTDKPASWLILSASDALGQLTVWATGEAEMDWGTPDNGGSRHYDLESRDDLNRCVDDLEAELRLLG
jgi:hypothetical protein